MQLALQWFVHPYYDNEALYYDVAVGLLERPVPDAPKVKVRLRPISIYDLSFLKGNGIAHRVVSFKTSCFPQLSF